MKARVFENRRLHSKAQFFSTDFLVAVALLAVATGVMLQASQTAQTRLLDQAKSAWKTDAFANALLNNEINDETLSARGFCKTFSDGTDECGDSLSGCKRVLATTRLAKCMDSLGAESACVLWVKACG